MDVHSFHMIPLCIYATEGMFAGKSRNALQSHLFLNRSTTVFFVTSSSISNVSLCPKMIEKYIVSTLLSIIFILTTCGSSLFHPRASSCLLLIKCMVFLCISPDILTIGKPLKLLIQLLKDSIMLLVTWLHLV